MLSMMRRAFFPAEVISGAGSAMRLRFIEGTSCVLVIGKSSMRSSGQLDTLVGTLENAVDQVTVLDGYSGDPAESSIRVLADDFDKLQPDWVVAAGGGATIDAVKLARLLYENSGKTLGDFARPNPEARVEKLKFAVLPTTAGSGAESSIAAIYTSETGTKQPVVTADLLPDIAILDPAFTTSMSPELTYTTGLDSFTHALESYCSPLANVFSKSTAINAGRLMASNLQDSITDSGNVVVRENTMIGAYYGGVAQSITSTGAVHAVAHAVGEIYGVNHGRAIAAILPGMASLTASHSEKVGEFFDKIGLESPERFAVWIEQLNTEVGLPSGLDQRIDSASVISRANADICMRTAAYRPQDEELDYLLERISL